MLYLSLTASFPFIHIIETLQSHVIQIDVFGVYQVYLHVPVINIGARNIQVSQLSDWAAL